MPDTASPDRAACKRTASALAIHKLHTGYPKADDTVAVELLLADLMLYCDAHGIDLHAIYMQLSADAVSAST